MRLLDVWVGVRDPRPAKRVEHRLVDLQVVAVCAVLSGADTFVAVEVWGKEKLDWLRKYLELQSGPPCHDTFGRIFAAIDPDEFGAALLRWLGQVVPALTNGEVVAIDGRMSRRSGKMGATPLNLVSAFAGQAGLVLGQRATAAKSNEKRPPFTNCWRPWHWKVATSPSTPWALSQPLRKPLVIAVPTMSWRSRTISPHWPRRSSILSAPSRRCQARRLISFTKSSTRTMAASKFGGAISSTRLTACTRLSAGQT